MEPQWSLSADGRRPPLLLFLFPLFLLCISLTAQTAGQENGAVWLDTDGKPVNAHGGGMLRYGNRWYWYGEFKEKNTTAAHTGISVYSSSDLRHWKNEGIALAVSSEAGSDIEAGCVMERPKVVYNARTKQFVLWFHLELKGKGYSAARAAVAVADRPAGPFRYLRSLRPNARCYPADWTEADIDTARASQTLVHTPWWTPAWRKAIRKGLFLQRDFEGGQMARDCTLFLDDDGKAYHLFASEDNLTLHLAELSEDYLSHTGRYYRIAPGGQNEAPTIFKHGDTYWLITSGCTGWEPNEARMFSAKRLAGPWKQHPSPFSGTMSTPHINAPARKTFGAQGTYIFSPRKGEYVFMADIWRPHTPADSRYLWLPIAFAADGTPVITGSK